MKKINTDDIIRINKKHDGTLINISNLDYAVERANNEKNIYKSNAYLLRGIIQGHPFIDGNKSTATDVVLGRFYNQNIKCDDKLFKNGILKLAKEINTPLFKIERRLRKWCKKK